MRLSWISRQYTRVRGQESGDRGQEYRPSNFVGLRMKHGSSRKNPGFSSDVIAKLDKSKILRIRAGTQPHRFIGIWVVVVHRRVFARSWSIKPQGWYRTFLKEPCGTLEIDGQEIPIRAIRTRSERLKDAVDAAYLEKYNTPGSIRYARDLGRAKSRATTTELVPVAGTSGWSATDH
jgi:hypothetical protein